MVDKKEKMDDMDQDKNFQVEKKHMLALASILGRAVVLPFFLRNHSFDLSDNERGFVDGYIKYGFLVLFCFLSGVGVTILQKFYFDISILYRVFWLFILAGFALIFVGIFGIFTDQVFLQNTDNYKPDYDKLQSGNVDLVINYIPIYNFYLRDFGKDKSNYRWLKESIILWTFWTILTLVWFNPVMSTVLLAVIILRVVTLLGGMDFLDSKYKQQIDQVFDQNIEEVYGYVKGTVLYIFEKMKNKGVMEKDIKWYIDRTKKYYSTKIDITKYRTMWIQYGILAFIFLNLGSQLEQLYQLNIYAGFYTFGFILFLGRYAIYLKYKKLPRLPVLHDISVLIDKGIDKLSVWLPKAWDYIIDLFK